MKCFCEFSLISQSLEAAINNIKQDVDSASQMWEIFTRVIKLAAVIGSGEQRHQLTLREELVAVFHNLMSATDQIEIMLGQKLCHNLKEKKN